MSYKPGKYKIIGIKNYALDVKLFKIKCNLNPGPGQFVEASVPGIGECTLASCSYNKNYLELLMKNAGTVTSQLFKLRKGNKIFIRGNYGNSFPFKKLKGKNIIFIAGGTGIAPVTSLIEYTEKNKKEIEKIFIYFCFRNRDYILLEERIKKWKKKFRTIVGIDKKEKGWKGETGFINEILERNKPEIKNSIAFLCGPEVMMKSATEKLNELGLENNKIYWSLERRMECGFGNCGRCLIQEVYVCRDGPIFRYDKIKPKLESEESSNKIK